MRPGKVLDVGCAATRNYLPASLALLGWEVWGIDIREWKFKFPNFHFVVGDIRQTTFPDNFFDCVYAVSTLDHIGLSGRYGITKYDPQGDFKAIREIARILRNEGTLLITIPYGKKISDKNTGDSSIR
jgi:SAM-dependent methyltransferase